MSDERDGPDPQLSFRTADYASEATGSLRCASCDQPISDRYYSASGSSLCERCKGLVELAWAGGSPALRVLKACVFGLGAAAVSSGIWMAVTELTGYEIGLIAIAVGFLVGHAVRIGSEGRGGLPYQLIAMSLTYLAIVATYVPYIVQGMEEAALQQSAPAGQPAEAAPFDADLDSVGGMGDSDETRSLAELIFFGVVIVAVAVAAPFLAGFENLIGIFIIGIGVFEAWRRNAKAQLTIEGPFRLGAGADG